MISPELHESRCSHRRGMEIRVPNTQCAKPRKHNFIDDSSRLAQQQFVAKIDRGAVLDSARQLRYGANVRRLSHVFLQSMDRVCVCRPKAPALPRRSLELPERPPIRPLSRRASSSRQWTGLTSDHDELQRRVEFRGAMGFGE
jgi:hypothetical protein